MNFKINKEPHADGNCDRDDNAPGQSGQRIGKCQFSRRERRHQDIHDIALHFGNHQGRRCIGKGILDAVGEAIEQLKRARQTEGQALLEIMERIVSDMEAVVIEAKATADVQPAQMMARLNERVTGLLSDSRISEERLEQELAILVSKADITEEVDRLSAHLVEARNLFNSGKAVGRKLDFLSQELLREANTLGSKSASLEMTRHSLALKSLIDQFKEQSANVE